MTLYKEIGKLHQEFSTRQILKALEDFQQRQRADSIDPKTKAQYTWFYVALRGLNDTIDSTDHLIRF